MAIHSAEPAIFMWVSELMLSPMSADHGREHASAACAVSMNAKSHQMVARHSRLKSKSLGSESDGLAFPLFRRFRELLNDLENRFELSVVFLLHLC
jgi:hypothetical protein